MLLQTTIWSISLNVLFFWIGSFEYLTQKHVVLLVEFLSFSSLLAVDCAFGCTANAQSALWLHWWQVCHVSVLGNDRGRFLFSDTSLLGSATVNRLNSLLQTPFGMISFGKHLVMNNVCAWMLPRLDWHKVFWKLWVTFLLPLGCKHENSLLEISDLIRSCCWFGFFQANRQLQLASLLLIFGIWNSMVHVICWDVLSSNVAIPLSLFWLWTTSFWSSWSVIWCSWACMHHAHPFARTFFSSCGHGCLCWVLCPVVSVHDICLWMPHQESQDHSELDHFKEVFNADLVFFWFVFFREMTMFCWFWFQSDWWLLTMTLCQQMSSPRHWALMICFIWQRSFRTHVTECAASPSALATSVPSSLSRGFEP